MSSLLDNSAIKSASSLVVSLGKALNGIASTFEGYTGSGSGGTYLVDGALS